MLFRSELAGIAAAPKPLPQVRRTLIAPIRHIQLVPGLSDLPIAFTVSCRSRGTTFPSYLRLCSPWLRVPPAAAAGELAAGELLTIWS